MVDEFDVKFESGKYYSYVGMASDSGNLNHDDCPDINSQTLKIDVEMAIAMTEGYKKNGDMFRTCIMSSSPRSKALEKDFLKYPKLITHNKIDSTKGNTPLSGRSGRPLSFAGVVIKNDVLKKNNYYFCYKYIAVLIAKYYIKNSLEVWRDICNTDIFGIWEPEAPFNNIKDKDDPLILLLRVYKLQDEYSSDMINFDHHDLYDKLCGDTILCLGKPVISDKYFFGVQVRLDEILVNRGALVKKEMFVNAENVDIKGVYTLDTKIIRVEK